MSNHKIWYGGISFDPSGTCCDCDARASVLFQIGSNCACRACVLDPARGIRAIDRRGDVLRTPERIGHELDLRAGIVLHLESRGCESPPLPADYVRVLAVLDRLTRADDESGSAIAEMRESYKSAACFTPKQMLFVQWRLAKCGIEHEPRSFAVSLRSDRETAQIRGFNDWRKKKIAPYLSWEQRGKFGF